MSYKNFSTAQNSPTTPKPADKPKDKPVQAAPSTQPETAPAVSAPAPKS